MKVHYEVVLLDQSVKGPGARQSCSHSTTFGIGQPGKSLTIFRDVEEQLLVLEDAEAPERPRIEIPWSRVVYAEVLTEKRSKELAEAKKKRDEEAAKRKKEAEEAAAKHRKQVA